TNEKILSCRQNMTGNDMRHSGDTIAERPREQTGAKDRAGTPPDPLHPFLPYITPSVLVIGLALAWLLSRALPLTLLDFEHYVQPSPLLWQGQNPYGLVEFFAPPWLALLLAPLLPLPIKLASAIWILLTLAAIGATAGLSQQMAGAPRRRWARQASLVLM